MSKTIIIITLTVLVAAGAYGLYHFSLPERLTEAEARSCRVDSDCLVFGEDGDCNCGCFNKEYQWKKKGECFCAAPRSCRCVNGSCEEVFEPDKETAVREVLAEKYGKDVSEVTIEITQEGEDHLRGRVVFFPGGPENSGIFLAAKTEQGWELVHDGQGSYSCSAVEEYGFPEEMTSDCFSQ